MARKHSFVVGQQYENEKGLYIVLELAPDSMLVQYQDGTQQTIKHLETQQRIVERVLEGREDAAAPVQGKRTKRFSKKPERPIQAFIAPIIADIILKRYQETNTFVTRAEIVERLTAHKDAHFFLQENHHRTEGHFTFEEYVGNRLF